MAPMDPRSERIVRRTTMVGAVTAAYLLLTADYGPNYPNPVVRSSQASEQILGPGLRENVKIKKAMESSTLSFKDLIFKSGKDGLRKEQENSETDGKK